MDGHGIHLNVSHKLSLQTFNNLVQGNFFRYEVEIERHQKLTKCPGCDENTKPELPTIKFQIGLVPSDQIKTEKSIGLQRKSY